MAIYQGVFLSAVAAGAFPGGWLATRYGLGSPFWAYAALAGVVTMLALVFVPETRPHAETAILTAETATKMGFVQHITLLAATPGFLLVSFVTFVNFFARTGAIFNVIPIFADEQIGLGTAQIGLAVSLVTITSVILVYPSGMLVDRFGRKGVIVCSTVFAGLGMLLFSMAGSYAAFLVAAFVWGVGSGVSGAAPAAYAADLAPKGMTAPAMSMYRTIADLGYVIGPLWLGILSDLASSQAALIFTAVLLGCSGLMFLLRAPETLARPVAPSRTSMS
jgi:MFS family permease